MRDTPKRESHERGAGDNGHHRVAEKRNKTETPEKRATFSGWNSVSNKTDLRSSLESDNNELSRKRDLRSSMESRAISPPSSTGSLDPPRAKFHLQVVIPPMQSLSECFHAKDSYNDNELIKLRDTLNATKSLLDIFHLEGQRDKRLKWQWNTFNGTVDMYRSMRFTIANDFNGQIVTNAWMKYYEIIRHYGLIPHSWSVYDETRHLKDGDERRRLFKAFFNAELPGAAVCAFNHYMKTKATSIGFHWVASSLAPEAPTGQNPHDSNNNCLGDQYGLYECNKDRWLMQIDRDSKGFRNDGDATKLENLLDWESEIGPDSRYGGVDFYSHDAGIDVSDGGDGKLGFNDQEMANAKIHLGCALAGFMTLRKGGSFIAKQYTFFETFTWNLIIIYASLFKEFRICKPLTSRPRNSEIYLVGWGFKGLPDNVRKLLTDRLKDFNTRPFLEQNKIEPHVLQVIKRFAHNVYNQQMRCISENVTLFHQWKRDLEKLKIQTEPLRNEVVKKWIKEYQIEAIKEEDKLPSLPLKRY